MSQAGRYTVVRGMFQLRHDTPGPQPRPDGDTVQFVVDAPDVVRALPRFSDRAPKISASGAVSLRLEVIDALETHFPTLSGAGPEVHQPLALAYAARDFLLKTLGFRHVVFDDQGVATSADALRLPGYVLANGIEANGRVVALLYPGPTAQDDGATVWVTPAELRRSANIASLSRGWSYATLYSSQPHELTLASRAFAAKARLKARGVYAQESVGVGRSAAVASLDELQTLVMLPKLFRRLAEFFAETSGTLADFDAWVRADAKRDDKVLLPSGEVGNLHDVYDVAQGRIGLKYLPEDLLFLE